MSEYPDSDEEFELMYNDELELLSQMPEPEEPPSKVRRTLDFTTPSISSSSKSHSQDSKENADPNTEIFDPNTENVFTENIFTGTIKDQQASQALPLAVLPEVSPINTSNINPFQGEGEAANVKKRTIEELFGDIDDILYENQGVPKKHKGDQKEADLALIEQIVELRKLSRQKNNLLVTANRYNVVNSLDRDKYNLSFRVPKYPFVAVTRHDGERVYVRCHSEEYEKEESERIFGDSTFTGVMGDMFKDVWAKARELVNKSLDRESQSAESEDQDISILDEPNENKQLWVELYKPRKYFELLSDEGTNRIMLKWLKLWDKVVFNRRPKIKPNKKPVENNFGKNRFQRQELQLKLGDDGRPEYKVALLCGPPGLGKTTLAHMVARHCGYNVVEINASDDRSLDAFKTSLENATQMRSVVDVEKRPNCLVFDEIDGAPAPSIDYLVKFINGTATTKAKKGKTKTASALKRPIICICNDAYVPALKPLRQISFVVSFPQISASRLAERLMEIARKEQIKTDIGAMMALAEKSNNDIRSCLSVLHFFKSNNKRIMLSDIYKTSVGQKDMQKGLFAVWHDIFHIERPKNNQNPSKENGFMQYDMSLKSRMTKTVNLVASFGDYDRLAQGVFENYPKMKIKETASIGVCEALEWFCFSDILSTKIYTLQNYSLTTYLQYGFVVWHYVFASMTYQKIQYPSMGYEVKTKQTRQKAVIAEVLRGMQPQIRVFCSSLKLILDILPFLSRIIVPSFRPVSLHLYTKEEKDSLLNVVNIMIDYNLNYVQERTAEGTYNYNLDPDVETVTTFSNIKTKNRQITYSNRQLIGREIDLEKVRRLVHKTAADDGKSNSKKSDEKTKPLPIKASPTNDAKLPNHMQRLKAKAVKAKSVPAVTKDFFGRIIQKDTSNAKIGPELKKDIWFQYKEGYSNAVRKKIRVFDLK